MLPNIMTIRNRIRASVLVGITYSFSVVASDAADPYLWLEEIEGDRALAWTEEQSERTAARLAADPRFDQLKADYLASYQSEGRLPEMYTLTQADGFVYRIAQGPDHPRGLLQRTKPASFGAGEAAWETLVDIDALAEAEGHNWYVYAPMIRFSPDGAKALIPLSDGGSDAVSMREFDLAAKKFVSDGFRTPLARQMIAWVDENTLAISIVLEPDEATTSGYPRILRQWHRGTDVSEAEVLHSIPSDHVMLAPFLAQTNTQRDMLALAARSFTDLTVLRVSSGQPPENLPLPVDIVTAFWGLRGIGDELLLRLNTDFDADGKVFSAGSIIAANLPRILAGDVDGDTYRTVFTPDASEALPLGSPPAILDTSAYLVVLDNVVSTLKRARRGADGQWQVDNVNVPAGRQGGTLTLLTSMDPSEDSALLKFENFTTVPTMFALSQVGKLAKVQEAEAAVDLEGFETKQFFVETQDGASVPYFVVGKKGGWDAAAPTLMYGYGGFGIPMLPSFEVPYIGPMHQIWLERGGRFVLPNVRGGGEYGPAWHNAARGATRQIAYDDFAAVAEDLIARGLSRAGRIGFVGGSNGGLTAGVLATQRPDLFGASISIVPLLDMARFHKLLAGASWMPEYGNPEIPTEAEPLLRYSPYQNIEPDGDYPEMLLMTSTRDDRVHPGHARKMAARLMAQGHPALFYEAREGGHGMAVNDEGRAFNSALQTVYLLQKLMDGFDPRTPAN